MRFLLLLLLVILCTPPALAAETSVVIVEATKGSGLDRDDLNLLKEAVTAHVLASVPGSSLAVDPTGQNRKMCDDACALKVAGRAKAEYAVVYSISARGEEQVIVARLYHVPEGELVAMARKILAERPAATRLKGIEIDLVASVGEVVRSMAVEAPAPPVVPPAEVVPPASRFGEVSVHVTGIQHRTRKRVPAQAEVFVNGRLIGTTPYTDGFPPGSYHIQIAAHGNTWVRTVRVEAGKQYVVNATVTVPLSAEETLALDKEEAERQEEELMAQAKQHQVLVDEWKVERDTVAQQRKPMVVAASVLMPVGMGLGIAGVALAVNYSSSGDEYDDLEQSYLEATDPTQIESLRQDMADLDDERRRNGTLAAVFLPVGLSAIVAAIVVLAVAPKKPAPPVVPDHLKPYVDVSVRPAVGPGFAGLGLTGRF